MRSLLCCFLLLSLVSPVWATTPCSSGSIQALSSQLVDELMDTLQVRLDRTRPIACTSFVNLHHMEQSSALGRILGELSGNALAAYGYSVVEARLRTNTVQIQDGVGELALSRSLDRIPGQIPAHVVLAGTYAAVGTTLHVSARLIDAINHTVLSTASCRLHLTLETQALLQPDPGPKPASRDVQPVVLRSLASKADVRIIQQQLKSLGLYVGKIDGVWGRRSRAALDTFRKVHGLSRTSPWDAETQRALLGV
ncbi:hypothetical protein MASR1M90_02900 [Desulfovibrionales bacterium]